EKVKISVADVPFVVVTWTQIADVSPSVIQVTTNIDQQFALSEQHPLVVRNEHLYVDCGRNLWAKVHRNVVYQWAEIAQVQQHHDRDIYTIESAGLRFYLNQ